MVSSTEIPFSNVIKVSTRLEEILKSYYRYYSTFLSFQILLKHGLHFNSGLAQKFSSILLTISFHINQKFTRIRFLKANSIQQKQDVNKTHEKRKMLLFLTTCICTGKLGKNICVQLFVLVGSIDATVV